MAISIAASFDNFRELRERGSYYLDKTDIIEEYLVNSFDKAVLFAVLILFFQFFKFIDINICIDQFCLFLIGTGLQDGKSLFFHFDLLVQVVDHG